MSLYNMLFGSNPAAGVLLKLLRLDPETVPRLRDCYLDEGGERIIVYTRTGGGNRDWCAEGNARLAQHPLYVGDCDDDFDSTYAYFRFRIPDEAKHLCAELADGRPPPDKLWQALFDELSQTEPGPCR